MQILGHLPAALGERVRVMNDEPIRSTGQYVLYWMRTAIRAEENQALDVATVIANQLRLPVFVYQGLSERYRYASDRHHTFILQGARDVQQALGDTNAFYAFHLERDGHHGPHLISLSNQAALVVTEDMPVQPLVHWTESLCQSTDSPVLAVDTACVVPMRTVGKSFTRAFAFRDATKSKYAERVGAKFEVVQPDVADWIPQTLPFEPVRIAEHSIADLVSQCEIDHSIGPVLDTVGGSRAGYARWDAFKENTLSRYDKLRNDALGRGVSRMSPYLRYGMVAPTRIAREAASYDNPGAHKFLDELLIWRELAYTFCAQRPDHGQLSAIPDWALETLRQHETDDRPALHSWETLARGCTGDPLWDAAQKSLLIHGELHNNVRMTWGKELLNWMPDAEAALATLIDLNHRYALDGRDPASYGGLLWCLGQFDRPFSPERPIFGSVRWRSTAQHAQRLDTEAYANHTTRALRPSMPKVAVVGAGLSGLACARTLSDHGFSVTVFEKSRGPGGRMSTRRAEAGIRIDHGAQYFTARDERFRRYVSSWLHDGLVQEWKGRIVVIDDGEIRDRDSATERFVAVPGMNAIAKHLASSVDVRCQTQIGPLTYDGSWKASSEDGKALGEFDVVVAATPATQTAELLHVSAPIAKAANAIPMRSCWAVMIALPMTSGVQFDGAFVNSTGPEPKALSWIARNSSKPGRDDEPETWVLHASHEWSAHHLEDESLSVIERLTDEFWETVDAKPLPPIYSAAHRWRYAITEEPAEQRCLFDPELRAVACGDWCGNSRVEGALLSGLAAAGRVLGLLEPHERPRVSSQVA